MPVGGTEVPEALSIEGEHIVRIRCVICHGSLLDTDGDPSNTVRGNFQRVKQKIKPIGPLLKSSEVRRQRRAARMEASVKSTLLYVSPMTGNIPL